jgi:hypothetical protein
VCLQHDCELSGKDAEAFLPVSLLLLGKLHSTRRILESQLLTFVRYLDDWILVVTHLEIEGK